MTLRHLTCLGLAAAMMVAITPPRRPVFAQAQQTADAPLTAVLAGRVLDALSGAPVGSVTVSSLGWATRSPITQ